MSSLDVVKTDDCTITLTTYMSLDISPSTVTTMEYLTESIRNQSRKITLTAGVFIHCLLWVGEDCLTCHVLF